MKDKNWQQEQKEDKAEELKDYLAFTEALFGAAFLAEDVDEREEALLGLAYQLALGAEACFGGVVCASDVMGAHYPHSGGPTRFEKHEREF